MPRDNQMVLICLIAAGLVGGVVQHHVTCDRRSRWVRVLAARDVCASRALVVSAGFVHM